jgi:hypothetical protein
MNPFLFRDKFAAAKDLFLAARGLVRGPCWRPDKQGYPTLAQLRESVKTSARKLVEFLSDPVVNNAVPEIADLVFKQGVRAESTVNNTVRRYLPRLALAMTWFDSLALRQDEELNRLREELRTKCLKPIFAAIKPETKENLINTALSWQSHIKSMPAIFRQNMEVLFATCVAAK